MSTPHGNKTKLPLSKGSHTSAKSFPLIHRKSQHVDQPTTQLTQELAVAGGRRNQLKEKPMEEGNGTEMTTIGVIVVD